MKARETRVRAQHEQDFEAYVTARLPALRRVAAQLAGDAHRGDDLVQQAVTRLYTKWRTASQANNLDAYVHRILVRVFLDERRLGWSGVRLDETPADAAAPPGVDVENRLLLREALGRLPPRQRAAVVLRHIADLPVEDVADILQVSTGTVKSQTSAGLATLRRLLADQSTDSTQLRPGAAK
jgi:RNA polymerase sigma-70 factor (sigma-E family)